MGEDPLQSEAEVGREGIFSGKIKPIFAENSYLSCKRNARERGLSSKRGGRENFFGRGRRRSKDQGVGEE